jgi:basic membrane lipoprotein Med (substrate-binding protein (PBP1-ABC) superfamily)
MAGSGSLTPEVYKKVKKPFEDTLYVLGVKDCNVYLPSDDEVMAMIEASKKAQENKQPSPQDQKDLAQAELTKIKAQQIIAETSGTDAETKLDMAALMQGKPKVYS